MLADTIPEYHVVLAIHVVTIILTFGAIFAHPLVFAVARRNDPRSLPSLHRIEYTIERWLIGPGLLLVVLSGAYLAGFYGIWSAFYVRWAIGVAVVIGAALGAFMIPTARRAEAIAERDLHSGATGAVELSDEYRTLTRRLAAVGAFLGLLVLTTVLFMTIAYPE